MPILKEIIDRTLGTTHGTGAYQIVETLLDAGFEAFWVGGCVRDMLLGEIPDEIDIATEAKPEEVAKIFEKFDDASAALGVTLVSVEGNVFEVTTYREEHELSDGPYPDSVTFTDRECDAKRRDITVNALYWNPISSELVDPFDGEKDLNEKLVRFIGDPVVRIEHDALRLLRVIRFRARIDGQYHPDTFAALHKEAKMIEVLSGTRRFEELNKILMGPHPEIAFEDMWETDVIEYLLPELHACKGVAQPQPPHGEGDVWNHVIRILSSFTHDHAADVRWSALLHDIAKPVTFSIEEDRIHFNDHASKGGDIAKKVLDHLQCAALRRDKICWLIRHHMTLCEFPEMNDERKSHWYFHPWFTELLQLFWLDIAGTDPSVFVDYDRIIKDYNLFLDSHPRPPKPLLSGDEVMEILGIKPGEEVGQILKKLHEAQINGDISKRAEAEDFLKNELAS